MISACLLGVSCRYDGISAKTEHPKLVELFMKGQAIAVCPEVFGGLEIPRAPAEIQVTENGRRVMTKEGTDVTKAFEKGAQICLELCQSLNIEKAILKARSPSCGKGEIYDGTFSKKLRTGDGLTTALLKANGIEVFTEEEWCGEDLNL